MTYGFSSVLREAGSIFQEPEISCTAIYQEEIFMTKLNGTFQAFGPIWECDPNVWWQDVEINLRGTFHTCRVAALAMLLAYFGGEVRWFALLRM
jgi:hypothetical protein